MLQDLQRRSSLGFPESDRARIRGGREQLRYGLVLDGMAGRERDFRQRHQNKPPLSHARMRNFKLRRADDARSAKQNIEVDHARTAAHQTPPPDFALNLP